MFSHGFINSNDINLPHTHTYIFDADDELRLHKMAVSINYLWRVVLDFNSVVFVFYFNWMRVTDYCIL
jgi:hypothetical protein